MNKFEKSLKDKLEKKKQIRAFIQDHLPFIHRSGKRKGKLVPIFTSKKAQFEVVEQLTDSISDLLIDINIIK